MDRTISLQLFGIALTLYGGFLFLGDHLSLTPEVGYWLMAVGVLVVLVAVAADALAAAKT